MAQAAVQQISAKVHRAQAYPVRAPVAPRQGCGSLLVHTQRNRSAECTRTAATAEAATASPPAGVVDWSQKTFSLPSKPRGCHIVTRDVTSNLPELGRYEMGMLNLFVQHTSASLTINENASPDVPLDLNDSLDRIVPEGRMYRHLDEGMDDMPAHVKSSLMGASLSVPISKGRMALGTWQGLYLNEHRDHGGARRVVATIQGKLRADGKEYGKSLWGR